MDRRKIYKKAVFFWYVGDKMTDYEFPESLQDKIGKYRNMFHEDLADNIVSDLYDWPLDFIDQVRDAECKKGDMAKLYETAEKVISWWINKPVKLPRSENTIKGLQRAINKYYRERRNPKGV